MRSSWGQEASDHVPQASQTNSSRTPVDTDFAILLSQQGHSFEPNAAVCAFTKLRQARTRGAWFFCPCGSRTFATPFPFRHPHGHVLLCSPSQCCGQEARGLHLSKLAPTTGTHTWLRTTSTSSVATATMSAFSTVGDVRSQTRPQFSAPGTSGSTVRVLVPWKTQNTRAPGSLIMPKRSQ